MCAVLSLLMNSAADAAQWTATPAITWGVDYQDNPRLLLKDAQAVAAASLEVQTVLDATAESAQFSAAPRVRAVRYPGNAELDNDSRELALNYRYEGEYGIWSIAGNTARDSTLTTEFEDTGLVQARKWRRSSSMSPSWLHEWSETLNGRVTAGYSDVAYENATATLLADYSYKNIDAAMNWESGERSQWGISLTLARLDAPVYRNTSDDYGAQVSFAYAWSETRHLNVSGGARYNELRLAPGARRIHERARGWTLDAGFDTESERNTWHVQASRSVDPSGVGVLVQKDKLVLALARGFTEQVSGSVNVVALQTEELQRENINSRRQYARVGMQASWAWASDWTLGAAYGYTQQHYQGVSGTQQGNNVQLTLTWQGEPRRFNGINRNLQSEENGTEY